MEIKKKEIPSDEFPWSQVFVAGYGAGMRTLGTSSIDHYAPVDAVYTLFRYDEPLLNPELVLRRVEDKKKKNPQSALTPSVDELRRLLSKILNLGSKGALYITPSGIKVSGPWGRRTPIESIGVRISSHDHMGPGFSCSKDAPHWPPQSKNITWNHHGG